MKKPFADSGTGQEKKKGAKSSPSVHLGFRAFLAVGLAVCTTYHLFGQTRPIVTLSANHDGHKEYDGSVDQWQTIDYTTRVSMQFTSQPPVWVSARLLESTNS